MKAVLIGAGEESLHTIEAARRLGVSVTALDGNPEAPGLKAADEGLAVDISREDEVLDALRGKDGTGPDFVLTGPLGRYLTTAGVVNDAFHLRGISRQSAVWCTDKYLFHEKLREAGLRGCRCELVPAFWGKEERERRGIVDNLLETAREFSFPAILKPRYGSGSRGIFFLDSVRELETALWELAGEPGRPAGEPGRPVGASGGPAEEPGRPVGKNGGTGNTAIAAGKSGVRESAASEEDYVLEEAVSGTEYGVDAALDGRIYRQILLRRKLLTPPPARQAVGYFSVTGRTEEEAALIRRVQEQLSRAAETLRLQDCLFHADLMIEGERVFIIELSARPSGHHLHDRFTPMATGVDMAETYIRSQCGLPYSYEPRETRGLLIRYFALPEGVVRHVPEKEELNLPEDVILRAWDCGIRPGDRLERVINGHSVMGRGYFILEGDADEKLEAAAEGILGRFAVERG